MFPLLMWAESLCSAADGDEGGRHQLITASVSNGNLYILKIQVREEQKWGSWSAPRHASLCRQVEYVCPKNDDACGSLCFPPTA